MWLYLLTSLALLCAAPIAGRYDDSVGPLLAGQFVFDANETVPKMLQERGALLNQPGETPQWFLSLEHDGLRQKALEQVRAQVTWVPPGGRTASRACSPRGPTGRSRGSAPPRPGLPGLFHLSFVERLLAWSADEKVPAVGLASAQVKQGALFALAPAPLSVGQQAGRIANRASSGFLSTTAEASSGGPLQRALSEVSVEFRYVSSLRCLGGCVCGFSQYFSVSAALSRSSMSSLPSV